tara:strand:- start:734 stop:1639 length:906 start_codon:yes stop_codon:yes gene_type:complete
MLRIVNVPNHLMGKMPIDYPLHHKRNIPQLEEICLNYFLKNAHKIETNYIYLPIQWTPTHIMNSWGENLTAVTDFCNSLTQQYPDEKFFSVVQWDGGSLIPVDNCTFFSGGGRETVNFSSPLGKNSKYYPVPLMCDHHPVVNIEKKYKASYAGRRTHPVRDKMIEMFADLDGYNICDNDSNHMGESDIKLFRNLMYESIFALCPRGYGPTSFRLFEAIQMGCVPIYIGDDFWLPFENYIDWKKMCVLVDVDDIDKIPKIIDKLIETGQYKKMLEYGKECFDNYLSKDSVPKTIIRTLVNEK